MASLPSWPAEYVEAGYINNSFAVCGVPNQPCGLPFDMMESFCFRGPDWKIMSICSEIAGCSYQKSLSLKAGLTCGDDARAQG